MAATSLSGSNPLLLKAESKPVAKANFWGRAPIFMTTADVSQRYLSKVLCVAVVDYLLPTAECIYTKLPWADEGLFASTAFNITSNDVNPLNRPKWNDFGRTKGETR
jgi:hypothetical protein